MTAWQLYVPKCLLLSRVSIAPETIEIVPDTSERLRMQSSVEKPVPAWYGSYQKSGWSYDAYLADCPTALARHLFSYSNEYFFGNCRSFVGFARWQPLTQLELFFCHPIILHWRNLAPLAFCYHQSSFKMTVSVCDHLWFKAARVVYFATLHFKSSRHFSLFLAPSSFRVVICSLKTWLLMHTQNLVPTGSAYWLCIQVH